MVVGNVVFETDWGTEAASPGRYADNLVFNTRRNGFHLSDSWGLGLVGLEIVNNAVVGAGEHDGGRPRGRGAGRRPAAS